jgi:hypothetical protein
MAAAHYRPRASTVRSYGRDIGSEDNATYHELVATGMTDYLAVPLTFGDGRRNVVSFATLSPIGFTDDDLVKLPTPAYSRPDRGGNRAPQCRRDAAQDVCR